MNDTEKWPGVTPAYDFVKPSYDWMLHRLKAANGRIQNIMNFSATVAFAAPVLAKAVIPSPSYSSWWFYLALSMFGLVAALWAYGIMSGTVKLASPGEMIKKDEYYGATEWEFKKNMLYNAARAYNHNSDLVRRRGTIAIIQAVAFVVQLAAFGTWILV